MGKTAIEWTDESSNPIRFILPGAIPGSGTKGWACVKKSAGCAHCYSERMNGRLGTHLNYTTQSMRLVEPYLEEKELARLLRMQKPRKVFICDMTDLFGEFMPHNLILRVFDTMAECPAITFQVLTKRADKMRYFCDEFIPEPLPNVWLGVSVENQQAADERIPLLLQTPAAVRFVSCEPLLGPLMFKIDWLPVLIGDGPEKEPGLDWIIAGGESGPGARPMHPAWVCYLRDRCQEARIPFFFKQWGEFIPKPQIAEIIYPVDHPEFKGWSLRPEWSKAINLNTEWGCLDIAGKYLKGTTTWNGRQGDPQDDYEVTVYHVGKKRAGRLLDGRTWSEFPNVSPESEGA